MRTHFKDVLKPLDLGFDIPCQDIEPEAPQTCAENICRDRLKVHKSLAILCAFRISLIPCL